MRWMPSFLRRIRNLFRNKANAPVEFRILRREMGDEFEDFRQREGLGANMHREGDDRSIWFTWNDEIKTALPFDELFETPQILADASPTPGGSMLKRTVPMGFKAYERDKTVFESITKVLKPDANKPDI